MTLRVAGFALRGAGVLVLRPSLPVCERLSMTLTPSCPQGGDA